MSKVVSVIIPTFNRCSLLPRAVDSALAQTHIELEIIIVNDGSTDNTADILEEKYGDEPRIKIIHQKNGGVCSARNRALDAATGDFIAFLDSDDVWYPWKLEIQLACLSHRRDVGMVWTDFQAIGPDGAMLHARFLRRMYSTYGWFSDKTLFETAEPLGEIMHTCPEDMRQVVVRWGRIGHAMAVGNLVHTSTVLLRREWLEKVGRFDESLAPAGEDHDFHLRVCELGPVALMDAPSIQYQTGLADRLTRYREVMARNYLLTMDRAVARAAADSRPPWQMLRKARAMGHGWLANAILERGDRAGARKHLIASLWYNPFQPRQAAELALTALPQSLDDAARSAFRRWRRSTPSA